MPVVDIASGIIIAIFSSHSLISSYFKSAYSYFFSFSVMVLWRLWLLAIATSIECGL